MEVNSIKYSPDLVVALFRTHDGFEREQMLTGKDIYCGVYHLPGVMAPIKVRSSEIFELPEPPHNRVFHCIGKDVHGRYVFEEL